MIVLGLVFVALCVVLWVLSAVLVVEREADQARRHRDSWLPRTDPHRAQQLRDSEP